METLVFLNIIATEKPVTTNILLGYSVKSARLFVNQIGFGEYAGDPPKNQSKTEETQSTSESERHTTITKTEAGKAVTRFSYGSLIIVALCFLSVLALIYGIASIFKRKAEANSLEESIPFKFTIGGQPREDEEVLRHSFGHL